MLQDFAEKCNRSGEFQMHLMLISHKEIANYIDKLPKQKVDGWRGVSERFKHIHLNNNFTQTYEIVESAIQKRNPFGVHFVRNFKVALREFFSYTKHTKFLMIYEMNQLKEPYMGVIRFIQFRHLFCQDYRKG